MVNKDYHMLYMRCADLVCPHCLTGPPKANVAGKIIDSSRTNSNVLKFEVTELNLTKILHNVQK